MCTPVEIFSEFTLAIKGFNLVFDMTNAALCQIDLFYILLLIIIYVILSPISTTILKLHDT